MLHRFESCASGLTVDEQSLAAATLALMDQAYDFSGSTNAEIRQRWSTLAARAHFHGSDDRIRDFLCVQGKQKYTLAVYRALVRGDERSQALARSVFDVTRDMLHVNVRNYVEKILSGGSSHSGAPMAETS